MSEMHSVPSHGSYEGTKLYEIEMRVETIEKHLGLSEHEEQCGCNGAFKCYKHYKPTEQGKVWVCGYCKAQRYQMLEHFCGMCGTPRPKEQTLEERVAEAISKSFGYLAGADTCRNAADAAITTVLAYQKEMMK